MLVHMFESMQNIRYAECKICKVIRICKYVTSATMKYANKQNMITTKNISHAKSNQTPGSTVSLAILLYDNLFFLGILKVI